MTAQPKLDPRGLKRICGHCGTRFYDMNKRPIVCPSCETPFEGVKIKGKRSKPAPEKAESQVTKATEKDDDDKDDAVEDDDVMSLDDAAEMESSDDDDDDDASMDLDDDLDDLDDLDADDDMDDDDLDDLDADIKVSKDDD